MGGQPAPARERVHDAAGPWTSDTAELFKAVAHPVRARILELLCRGECSIPELCEGTGVKPSHLSRHLTQMRAQHLIRCLRSDGRLLYRLAYPEAAELLTAARRVLHARTAAAVSHLDRMNVPAFPDSAPTPAGNPSPSPAALPHSALPPMTVSDEEFSAVEASLESRSLIGDACESIAARTGCSQETAARRLISAARARNITLQQAAADEVRNQQERPGP